MDHSSEVVPTIHPSDTMYSGNAEHYHSCGDGAVRNIRAAIAAAGGKQSPGRILDFACGFGRVGRYLRAAFPSAAITFTDVNREACAFCASTFNGTAKPTNHALADYAPGGPFDLIWVGSLFTHLPEAKSRRLLDLLHGLLAPGGVLAFTTHGRYVKSRRATGRWIYKITAEQFDEMIAQAEGSGYGFASYEGAGDYGISLSTLAWWEREISRLTEAGIVAFCERGWDRHQDFFAIQRG